MDEFSSQYIAILTNGYDRTSNYTVIFKCESLVQFFDLGIYVECIQDLGGVTFIYYNCNCESL